MRMPPDARLIINSIMPFDNGARGAGLKEAALAVLERHGGASTDAVMTWCCQSLVPLIEDLPGVMQETVPFYGAMHEWARLGCPHFSLTPDFFSAVALTDFGDPTEEPLYMPFNAFTMSFPPTEFFDFATKLMVYRLPKMMISGNAEIQTIQWKLYRATLLKEEPIFTQWDIGMTRKELAEEGAQMDSTTPGNGVRPLDVDEKDLPRRMRTLLANVMSYVESHGPLPTVPRAKRNSVPAPVELIHNKQPIYDIGRTVKLDGKLRRALLDSAGSPERWHVAQRYVVRGHWRNQAYGEGRALRRRQWIEPHWKGPENAVDAINRTYEVT